MAEYFNEKNNLPPTQMDTHFRGITPTDNVASITIANDGSAEVTITYTPAAGNGTIVLKPTKEDRAITWSCRAGTLALQYRPFFCR